MTLNWEEKHIYQKTSCFQTCRTDIQRGVNYLQGCFRKQAGREDV